MNDTNDRPRTEVRLLDDAVELWRSLLDATNLLSLRPVLTDAVQQVPHGAEQIAHRAPVDGDGTARAA